MAALGRLGAVGMLLLACGGRGEHSPHTVGAGAGNAGANKPGEAGGANVPLAGSSSVAQGGGAGSLQGTGGDASFEPLPIATEDEPSFEVPSWTQGEWSRPSEQPTLSICAEGWTPEQALVALVADYLPLTNAVLVERPALADLLDQMNDTKRRAEIPDGLRVVYLFGLPDGSTGVIGVLWMDGGAVYLYRRITSDCAIQHLGLYAQVPGDESCLSPANAPLWGFPPISAELKACARNTGLYAFDAEVTEDTCAATPAHFVGVLRASQGSRGAVNVSFPSLGGHPLANASYGLVDILLTVDGTAAATILPLQRCEGDCTCSDPEASDGPLRTTSIVLEAGESLTIWDQVSYCGNATEAGCSWKMRTGHIYGPVGR